MLEGTPKRSVQEMTVAALAATAVAAEEKFAPYVVGVASLVSKLMELKDEKTYSLRGHALVCMGHITISMNGEMDLHEFTYAAFANLAKVMENLVVGLGGLAHYDANNRRRQMSGFGQ